LRKGIRPLHSGKPDEVLREGPRVAVLDREYGSYRVEDPQENMQLAIYATETAPPRNNKICRIGLVVQHPIDLSMADDS